MIKTNNDKILRNLQEQVLYNSNVLEDFIKGDKTIAEFGIHVIGIYEQLPEYLDEEQLSVGDSILVGTEAPYAYYVWTNNQGEYEWVNIGTFPQPGPQGEQGPKGDKGDNGDASKWYYGDLPSPTGYTEGDMWLTKSGDVYTLTSNGWVSTLNIKGPRGLQGERGPRGLQGIQGPKGETGQTGKPGVPYEIKGILENTTSLEAITPESNTAYLVGATAPYDIYVAVPNAVNVLVWKFVGTTALNTEYAQLIRYNDIGYYNLDNVKTISGETATDDRILTSLSFNPEVQFQVFEGDNYEGDVHLGSGEYTAKISRHNVGEDDVTDYSELSLTKDSFKISRVDSTWDSPKSFTIDRMFNISHDGDFECNDLQCNGIKTSLIQEENSLSYIELTSNSIGLNADNAYVGGKRIATETDLSTINTNINTLENSVGQLRTDLEGEVDSLSNAVEGVENRITGKTVIDSYNIDEANQTINIVLGSL